MAAAGSARSAGSKSRRRLRLRRRGSSSNLVKTGEEKGRKVGKGGGGGLRSRFGTEGETFANSVMVSNVLGRA